MLRDHLFFGHTHGTEIQDPVELLKAVSDNIRETLKDQIVGKSVPESKLIIKNYIDNLFAQALPAPCSDSVWAGDDADLFKISKAG